MTPVEVIQVEVTSEVVPEEVIQEFVNTVHESVRTDPDSDMLPLRVAHVEVSAYALEPMTEPIIKVPMIKAFFVFIIKIVKK